MRLSGKMNLIFNKFMKKSIEASFHHVQKFTMRNNNHNRSVVGLI